MNNIFSSFGTEFYRNLIVDDRWKFMLQGLGTTLEITVLSILIGTFLGVILCFMKLSSFKPFKWIASTYITVFRGTPLVVQLLIIYFGVFGSINIPKVIVATIAFGMNSGAYVAEILRGGIVSVDQGQTEAGRSLGLSKFQTMFHIILPQAIKIAVPTYASEFIVLIKETAIVGYIALNDLTKVGDYIRSRTFSAWFPLITVALIYLFLTSVLSKLFGTLERRLRKSDAR